MVEQSRGSNDKMDCHFCFSEESISEGMAEDFEKENV